MTKRFLSTAAVALLLAHAACAREQSLLARVTVYWASGGSGSDRFTRQHQCATGLRLHSGHCAVDPRSIAYGSTVVLPDGTALAAVDTGAAVRSRKAARIAGRTVYERNAVVIDRFFETKGQALSWASRNPAFIPVRIIAPTRHTMAPFPNPSRPQITSPHARLMIKPPAGSSLNRLGR